MGANSKAPKSMEDIFANMPNPDAIFQSWWPFLIAGGSGLIYGLRQWLRGPKCVGGSKLKGKTIIVTGGNGCIGKEIALNMARRGGKVILACKKELEGKIAAEEIRKETENMDVYSLKLDLTSFASIRQFVQKFKKKEKNLHVLVNNAGVMMCPQGKTEDGFETHFQTNYLGPFLLTELLLDILKESEPSRIIHTTAAAHNLGDINFDDINGEKEEYNAGTQFAQSKLAVVLYSHHLAKRLEGTKVTSNVINPGVCNTEIYRHLPLKSKKFIRISFGPFMWFLMKHAEDGAQMAIYCGTTEEMEEVTGKYLKDAKQVELTGKSEDKMLQEQLYRASLKWIGDLAAVTDKGETTSAVKEKEKTEPESKIETSMERIEL